MAGLLGPATAVASTVAERIAEENAWQRFEETGLPRFGPGLVAQAVSDPISGEVDAEGPVAGPGREPPPGPEVATRRLWVTALALLLLAIVWWRLMAAARRHRNRDPF